MKTRNLFLGAMGLLAMASCSNDELVSVNHDGDEIAFNVVTNASTRVNADGVYCNNNLPETFYVWATTENGQTYINGDRIKKRTVLEITQELLTDAGQSVGGDGISWDNQSCVRYWPEENVNFYASVNALSEGMYGYDENYKFEWNDGNPRIKVTVPKDVKKQKDLLYAVKKGQNKSDGTVNLNFRHALSQVVFKARNTNAKLYVEVSGVSICKLNGTNTFTYPAESTDENIVDHAGTGNYSEYSYNNDWGTWGELTSNGEETYTVSFDPVNVRGTVSLTSTNEEGKEFSNNAMLLLPQKTTGWMPHGDSNKNIAAEPNPADQTGTYFLVKCQIWNIAGEEFNKATDVCLWGKEGAEDVAIPVDLDWKQGKKYIYTFAFDNFGGYNPGPNPGPNPEPVLVPISFDVTIDDFMPIAQDAYSTQGVIQILG